MNPARSAPDKVGEATVSVEALRDVRERVLPMLRFAAEEYRHRTPDGYPVVVDAVDTGMLGLELDPSHALYLVTDGDRLYADFFYRSSRTDARSSASREKFGGLPSPDRRELAPTASDQDLRNLIAELMARWNVQPGIIHITDS
jgi:hypothetical protein